MRVSKGYHRTEDGFYRLDDLLGGGEGRRRLPIVVTNKGPHKQGKLTPTKREAGLEALN